MAIAFDAATSTAGGATNPITWNHTCSGADRALIIAIGTNGGNPVSVRYGSVDMTNIGTKAESNTGHRVSLWKLAAPATGSNPISASFAAAPSYSCRSLSFTGVNQTDVNGTFYSGTGNLATVPVLSVVSSAGELVVDALIWNQSTHASSASVGAQQTMRGGAGIGNFVRCVMSTEDGSATVQMSYSMVAATNLAYCAVSLHPVPAAAPGIAWASQAIAINAAAGKTITITKPTGVVDGDVMLAALAWQGNVAILDSVPAGWTSIINTTAGAAVSNTVTAGVSMASYYRIASGEGASYTWSLSGVAVSNGGTIWRITGAHATTPFDAAEGSTGQGSNAAGDPATTNYNDELVAFLCAYNSGATGFSFTPPSGYTGHTDIETAGSLRLLGVEKIQAGAGSIGGPFALGNNAVAANYWAVQQVTFRPPTTSPDARQEELVSFPTDMTPYFEEESEWPISFTGWLNEDVPAAVLDPVPPTCWYALPDIFYEMPYEACDHDLFAFAQGPLSANAPTPTPTPGTVASSALYPRVSVMPGGVTDTEQWKRQASTWMQEVNKGHMQNTGIITLTANQSSTIVSDDRAGPNSFIEFMPRTANAALEKGNGTLYLQAQGNGTFTIAHATNAQTDRTYVYSILG